MYYYVSVFKTAKQFHTGGAKRDETVPLKMHEEVFYKWLNLCFWFPVFISIWFKNSLQEAKKKKKVSTVHMYAML